MLEELAHYFEEKDKVMFQTQRDVLRVLKGCSRAMRYIHARDWEKAHAELDESLKVFKGISKVCYTERTVLRAEQELVEGFGLWKVEKGESLDKWPWEPTPEALVLGLLDLGTELKRSCLEALRDGRDAHRYFEIMEKIYEESLMLVFPSNVLPEFRVKQDRLRYILETCREMLVR